MPSPEKRAAAQATTAEAEGTSDATLESVAARLYLILPGRDRLVDWEDMGKRGRARWVALAREVHALFAALAVREDK